MQRSNAIRCANLFFMLGLTLPLSAAETGVHSDRASGRNSVAERAPGAGGAEKPRRFADQEIRRRQIHAHLRRWRLRIWRLWLQCAGVSDAVL